MFELLKKALYVGLGAVSLTEEKLRQMLDEMVAQGALGKKEGEELIKEFLQTASENRQKWQQLIEERVKLVLQELSLVTKEDLHQLEQRLEVLEKRVQDLEKDQTTEEAPDS